MRDRNTVRGGLPLVLATMLAGSASAIGFGPGIEPEPQIEACPFVEPDAALPLSTEFGITQVRLADDGLRVRLRGFASRGAQAPEARLKLRVCVRSGAEVIGFDDAMALNADRNVFELSTSSRRFQRSFRIPAGRPGQRVQVHVQAIAANEQLAYDSGVARNHRVVWVGTLGELEDRPGVDDGEVPCTNNGPFDYAVQDFAATEEEPGIYVLKGTIRNVGGAPGPAEQLGFYGTVSAPGGGQKSFLIHGAQTSPLECGASQAVWARFDARDLAEGTRIWVELRVWAKDADLENNEASQQLAAPAGGEVPHFLTLSSVQASLVREIVSQPQTPGPAPECIPEAPCLGGAPGFEPQLEVRFFLEVSVSGQAMGTSDDLIVVLFAPVDDPVSESFPAYQGSLYTQEFRVDVSDRVSCGQTLEGRVEVYEDDLRVERTFEVEASCPAGIPSFD